VNAIATIRSAPGLESYLTRLESRLEAAVASHPGLVAEVGTETLAAGGKRLRPALTFLAAPAAKRHEEWLLAAGVAVELVHMATLVHDDLLDRAAIRRGQPTAWALHGEHAAKAVGDYLFARAFSELCRTQDEEAVALLAAACLALARGEALQRRQAFRPGTSVEEYLLRCSLKTGKLFEVACLLGGGGPELGEFGMALGIAFQIADDILDCTGDIHATGKSGGVDLRDGTPTLPLILAAGDDEAVWRALAGEPNDIAETLDRVAQTGALERSRELALRYAERARSLLNGESNRDALEALAYAVVHREQ
jgi:geranylgeranyl pyrophosphate synthase